VVAVSILWWAIWVYSHSGQVIVVNRAGGFYWRTDFRLDTFLIGGAFAIADWDWVKAAPVYLAAPVLLLLWVPFAIGTSFLAPMDTPVVAFVVAAVIAWLMANPESIAVRLLSRVVVIIGILSYSIYLWQQLFLVPFAHLFWWNYAGLALASGASYWLIERPFLRLRDRSRAELKPVASLVQVD
jgi:peptidoglycan/LPS O-acetylase OafA/YrhL